ncbi:MAG: class I SAM-dependent DNA methyltransferase [Isosphaerales bacterium]
MSVDKLVRELGYEESPNFLQESDFGGVPGYSHLFRRATARCRLKGVYALRDESGEGSPNVVPLVYVCEEVADVAPEEIHRLAWNQNVVPFVLVVARDVVRLYSGFSYGAPVHAGTGDTGRDGVLMAAVAFNQVASELGSFRADAIDRGELWRDWERRVDTHGRVDWQLLANLSKLGVWLRGKGLEKDTAHALIGKYVYLRYLRDREILSNRKFEEWGLDPAAVFGRGATVAGLRAVIRDLEGWLNGSVFPLELTGPGSPSAEHIERVAGAFAGDDPESGQLHLDFQPYDFSHIPIETLSVIYEQFLHAEGKGRDAGAYYTPVPLVNFMLQELEDRNPLRPGMRVLDGSCGSGAFLVQCYRRLIERRVRELGQRPRPSELRELLVQTIFGVDRDEDACRVAELSLSLTLLDYINPPDLRHYPKFKLPRLHNKNIFHSDFFAPKCPIQAADKSANYDWIVGNPPWVEVKKKDDEEEPREDLDRHLRAWIVEHRKSHPTGGNQAAQAFAWKLGAMLKPAGCAGLLLPAKTLFNYESTGFRKEFIRRHRLWCMANFSNMTEVLFAGRSRVPAAAFYFSPVQIGDDSQAGDEHTLTYSPFVANQEANRPADPNTRKDTWNIVVNTGEVRRIRFSDTLRGDLLTWKVAMWGSPRDERLIRSVRHRFPALSELRERLSIEIQEGFQLRSEGTKGAEFREDLVGKKILLMKPLRGCGRIFVFPEGAIGTIDRRHSYLRTRGGMSGISVSDPPHVIVDDARRFAVYSDKFLAVPPRQIGIAGQDGHAKLLKALSLFLVSDFATYYQFFTSPAWGVKRELATLRSLKEIPIPFLNMSDDELAGWERLHADAIRQRVTELPLFELERGDGKSLEDVDRELNEMTYAALALSKQERWLVEDLTRVRIELDEGKLGAAAVSPPKVAELEEYAESLSRELDAFLDVEGKYHEVRVVHDGHSGMVQISVVRSGMSPGRVWVEKAERLTSKAFARSRDLLRRRYSQWMYFDRRLLILDGEKTFLFKPLQRFHWTRGQALNDADLIIGETIADSEDANVKHCRQQGVGLHHCSRVRP